MTEKGSLGRRSFLKLLGLVGGSVSLATVFGSKPVQAQEKNQVRTETESPEAKERREYTEQATKAVEILTSYLAAKEGPSATEIPFSQFLLDQMPTKHYWNSAEYTFMLKKYVDPLVSSIHGITENGSIQKNTATTSPQTLVALLSVLLHHHPKLAPVHTVHTSSNMSAAAMITGDTTIQSISAEPKLTENSKLTDFIAAYNASAPEVVWNHLLTPGVLEANPDDPKAKITQYAQWSVKRLQRSTDEQGNELATFLDPSAMKEVVKPGAIYIRPESNNAAQATAGVIIATDPPSGAPTTVTVAFVGEHNSIITKPRVEKFSFARFALHLAESGKKEVVFITPTSLEELKQSKNDSPVNQPPELQRKDSNSLPPILDRTMNGAEAFFTKAANIADKIVQAMTGPKRS